MLDDLQRRIIVAAQEASPTVRLVGGAGLAVVLGHRRSDDVDLFCAPKEDIAPIVLAVRAAAEHEGAVAVAVRTGPSFQRLEVVHGGLMLRVDVAADSAQRLEAEATRVGGLRVETLRDQRANKLITLLGRSELRDLVDLYFLERAGFAALDGFEDALAKDGGMDPAWFAWALAQVQIRALPGMLVPLALEDLERYRDHLKHGVLRLAVHER